jgi:predicted enzyme related to lactoylglutathione lyase
VHNLNTNFHLSDAAGLRSLFRDKLNLKANDVGGGWLIFDLPEADLGCHPADEREAPSGTADISFYCDDIESTVAELKSKGVKFEGNIQDHGYGLVTHFKVPGDFTIQLYQPKYGKVHKK